jgi:hypothetical protein
MAGFGIDRIHRYFWYWLRGRIVLLSFNAFVESVARQISF